MATIESLTGQTSVQVGSDTYNFSRSRGGKLVAEVHNLKHIECLISCGAYAMCDPVEDAPAEDPRFMEPDEDIERPDPDEVGDEDPDAEDEVPDEEGGPDPDPEPATDPNAPPPDAAATTETASEPEPEAAATEAAEPEKAPEPEAPAEDPRLSDLTQIAGVGEATATKLNAAGILSLNDLAVLKPQDMQRIDDELDLHGSPVRGQWIEQAQQLVAEIKASNAEAAQTDAEPEAATTEA